MPWQFLVRLTEAGIKALPWQTATFSRSHKAQRREQLSDCSFCSRWTSRKLRRREKQPSLSRALIGICGKTTRPSALVSLLHPIRVIVRNPRVPVTIDRQPFHTYVPHPNCGDLKYLQNDESGKKNNNGLLNLIWRSPLFLSTSVAQHPAPRHKQLKVGVSDGDGRPPRSSAQGSLGHYCPKN